MDHDALDKVGKFEVSSYDIEKEDRFCALVPVKFYIFNWWFCKYIPTVLKSIPSDRLDRTFSCDSNAYSHDSVP